jgi:benzylsuccinate CoA-transferase BbsF subunit
MMDKQASLPLAGVRVIDMSWVLAGPVAGRLMADAGADVIKVESRKRLDNTRRGRSLPPAPGAAPDSDPLDRVPMFHNLNAGKKSIALDLSTPQGIALVRRLIAKSDVVLDNFAPGVMERLGLGYDVLKVDNPRLVMLSMSGTGQRGPLSDVPAYAPTVTSLAGLESLVGYEGEAPTGLLGLNLADSYAGVCAFQALLVALWAQRKHGIGQFIDFSEMEGICTMMAMPLIDCALNRRVMQPTGNRAAPDAAPHGVFPVAGDDAWIGLSILEDDEWQAFCAAAPDAPGAGDARHVHRDGRLAQRCELETALAGWTRLQDGPALVGRLRAVGVAAAPVHDIAGMVADPHFRERGVFRTLDIPDIGPQVVYGSPWRLCATPTLGTTGAPRLGEHTRQVLSEVLGVGDAEVDRLREQGILN